MRSAVSDQQSVKLIENPDLPTLCFLLNYSRVSILLLKSFTNEFIGCSAYDAGEVVVVFSSLPWLRRGRGGLYLQSRLIGLKSRLCHMESWVFRQDLQDRQDF